MIKINKWDTFTIKLEAQLLSINNLANLISSFKNNIIKPLHETEGNYTLLLQLKHKTDENINVSLSPMQRLNIKDFDNEEDLIEAFHKHLQAKLEIYEDDVVIEMSFWYLITDKDEFKKIVKASKITKRSLKPFKQNKDPYPWLPHNMDYKSWGEYIREPITKDNNIIDYDNIVIIGRTIFKFTRIEGDKYEVGVYVNNICVLSFIDEVDPTNKYTFKRSIINLNYNIIKNAPEFRFRCFLYYKDEKLIFKYIPKLCKFIEPLQYRKKVREDKFITMDIETKSENGVMTPVAICIYNGIYSNKFYLTDYNNINHMLKTAIKTILQPKYHNYKVYLHNFSNFDAYYLLSIISSLCPDVSPIIRDGKILDLKVKFVNNKANYIIYFRDSYLLLPASLAKLGKAFNVEVNKDIFPFKFLDSTSKLNYSGFVPSIKHFINIDEEQYKNYKDRFKGNWILKEELLSYCTLDCISLWQVIKNFSNEIWDLFKIDICDYPTTPSLAFAIYRKNFLKNFKIPIISGEMYENLVKGYYGGRCDVFIPTNEINEKINAYDVNSLYPFAMANYLMPVGTPYYFEGDIYKMDKDAFGFFEIEIDAPYLHIPFLPFKPYSNGYSNTIYPIGKWRGWYSSIEINKAIQLGYDIKILRGYTFEKGNIFSKYVNFLYKIKENSQKNSIRYTIAKLLLNSLYGRFGMNPIMNKHIIVDREETLKYVEKNIILDRKPLNNGKDLLSIRQDNDQDDIFSSHLNISVPISAMITAASSLRMYYFFEWIINNGGKIYYTDTDSAYTYIVLDSI